MADFEQSIDTILKNEGGFVDDPADPGGATNYGVSLRSALKLDLNQDGKVDEADRALLDLDHDGDVDADDMRKMPKATAIHIYREQWWERYAYWRFHAQEIATKVFDMAVNMGPKQAHKILQTALNELRGAGLIVDGILGPKTLSLANGTTTDDLLRTIRLHHESFYTDLVRLKPRLGKFLPGWLKRARS